MIRAWCLLLALLVAGTAAAAPPPPIDPARIATLVRAADFQGEVIVGRGDAIAYRSVTGMAAPGGPPNIAGERWRWASVTKQITALLVMQEVAAGTIDLDAPVTTYWPDWRASYASTITIRHLLRHQSGLADPAQGIADGKGIPAFFRVPGPGADPDLHAAGFCAERPRAAPPAPFHYNNCDYLVLGRVLARVTGKPFATLVAERITRPLGITDMGLFPWDRAEPVGVIGFAPDGTREPPINLGIFGAAGGLYGSADSLWRIDRALLRGELLDRVATAAMWAGEPSLGYAALGAWSFAAPLAGCPDPVRLIERRGEIGGVQIRNFLLPDQGTALILFTNRAGFSFGEVWQQAGLSHDLLAAIACPARDGAVAPPSPSPPPSNAIGAPS